MNTRVGLGTFLVAVAACLGNSACRYDDGGVGRTVDVERDASRPPGRPDARGSGVTATDARSGPDSGTANPSDAAGAPEGGGPGTGDAAAPDSAATPDAPPVSNPPPVGPPAACAGAATLPVSYRRLGQGPRSDDFAFDQQGHLIAYDGMNVVRVPRLGSIEVLAREVIGNRGGALRMTASGDIYLGDYQRDQVLVLPPTGAPRRLSGAVSSPMKMVPGPGGALYVTGQQGTIYRIEPASGTVTAAASTNLRLGGLSFTSDFRSLIVGGGNQGLQALDLRADGSLDSPRPFRAEVKNVQALAADACGSLYAIVENDSRIWRVTATTSEILADLRGVFAWSLAFGSGQQSWSASALYVMEATGAMYEVAVSVPRQPPLATAD